MNKKITAIGLLGAIVLTALLYNVAQGQGQLGPKGDITSVQPSDTSLTGGANTGAVALAVNTAIIQARVSSTCAAGSSIREIAANGTVTCETDDSGGVSDGDKGDITVTATGATWTIDNAVVTLAKMADLATARFLGRTTGGTGVPEALTGTQATAMLDTFTSVLQGLAPASGGGTSNFLRADGTWTAPAGGGDITDVNVAATSPITSSSSTCASGACSTTISTSTATNTLWGRNDVGTGVVEALTPTEVTAMLDLAATAATTKGLVPGGNSLGATYFFNAAGSYSVPAGGASEQTFTNTGSLNNFALTAGTTVLRWTGASALTSFTGVSGGTAGACFDLVNNGTGSITLVYNSGSSSAGNKFYTETFANVDVAASQKVNLCWIGSSTGWAVQGIPGADIFGVTAGTGLTGGGTTGSPTLTLNMTAQSCSAGQHISAATATGVFTCTADAGGGITGSGTSGKSTRWTGASAIGDGAFSDNGTQVGLGTAASATYLLEATKATASGGTVFKIANTAGSSSVDNVLLDLDIGGGSAAFNFAIKADGIIKTTSIVEAASYTVGGAAASAIACSTPGQYPAWGGSVWACTNAAAHVGVTSGSTAAANTNDWNPTSWSNAGGKQTTIRLTFGTAGDAVTGLSASSAVDGQEVTILIVGSNVGYLLHQSGLSTAANRILTEWGTYLTLYPGAAVRLQYYSSGSRWYVTGVSGSEVPSLDAGAAIFAGTSLTSTTTTQVGTNLIVLDNSTLGNNVADTTTVAGPLSFDHLTDAAATSNINPTGYNGGTTRTRSVNWFDGTGTTTSTDGIAFFDGVNRELLLYNTLEVDGTSQFDNVATFNGSNMIINTTTVALDNDLQMGDSGGTAKISTKDNMSNSNLSGNCGNGSPDPSGDRTAFSLTMGATGTTTPCTITFPVAFAATPTCVVSTQSATKTYTYTKSTTTVVITNAANNQVFDIICMDRY